MVIRLVLLTFAIGVFQLAAYPQAQKPKADELRGAVITFERSGGFAGVSNRFWI